MLGVDSEALAIWLVELRMSEVLPVALEESPTGSITQEVLRTGICWLLCKRQPSVSHPKPSVPGELLT